MVNEILYPIGTIFKMNNHSFIILGYQQSIVEDCLIGCYAIANYPLGFTALDDVCLISTNSIEEIVFCGYRDNRLYPTYIHDKSELFATCEKEKVGDLQHALDMIEHSLNLEEESYE